MKHSLGTLLVVFALMLAVFVIAWAIASRPGPVEPLCYSASDSRIQVPCPRQ